MTYTSSKVIITTEEMLAQNFLCIKPIVTVHHKTCTQPNTGMHKKSSYSVCVLD